eukprot:COSAG02_NODE_56244_length_286_cov_1.080214_1_plen_82_part_01
MVASCILKLGVIQTETSLQVYLLPPEDAYVEFMQVRYEAASHILLVLRALPGALRLSRCVRWCGRMPTVQGAEGAAATMAWH